MTESRTHGALPLVYAAGRQAGKTTMALDWVKQGVRTDGYPGWTRVLVVPTHAQLDIIRKQFWGEIKDFHHRVCRAR